MEKTRDLFKKIRDTKGTFHAKMNTIKGRNCMDLTGAENIKRWQEYTKIYANKIFTRAGVGCGNVGDVTGAWLASAPLSPSLWT